jgi:hypothetical protein
MMEPIELLILDGSTGDLKIYNPINGKKKLNWMEQLVMLLFIRVEELICLTLVEIFLLN